jgi:heptosyltransferase I
MNLVLSKPPEEICLLRLSAIGDTCHVVPVVRTLQAVWPNTRIVWVIGKLEASLMAGLDGVEFIIFDKSRGWRAYRDLRRQLAGRHFGLLLCMHASLRANLASRLINADIRLGFDRGRARDYQWLFTSHRIEAVAGQHVLDGLFGFLRALGIQEKLLRWDIPIPDNDRAFARMQIPDQDRPTLVISPCSSHRARNFRNWGAGQYAQVCDYVAETYGARVVLTGGSSALERQYGLDITRLSHCQPANLIGKTSLKQLLALLERASLLLCPDSGPAHMATAVGTPVVGLYATSNRFRTGPYLSQGLVVDAYPRAVQREFGKSVEEIPWGARVRDPSAMDLISVDEVKRAVDRVLGGVSAVVVP